MTNSWQQLLNEGDYHGALQSQGYPSFTPGDGSWTDYFFRFMHHRERPPMPEDVFLKSVSDCSLTVEEHDVYWKCYVDLCRYYQQPVQPCVFHTDFVKRSATDYARAMAKRGDIQGLDILCHFLGLEPCWEWIDLLPCTLEPHFYLHLIPWNDHTEIEERLIAHIQRCFEYTGQALQSLKLIAKAFQYLPCEEFPKLQQLREEYTAIRIVRELPIETNAQEGAVSLSSNNKRKNTLARKERSRFSRNILLLENSVKAWQEAACNAQQEAQALALERTALQNKVTRTKTQLEGIQHVTESFVNVSKDLMTESNDEAALDFLQDLHKCLSSLLDDSDHVSQDVVAQKQAMHVAKLESKVVELQTRSVECQTKETVHAVSEESVNQVSFSSMDNTVESTDESRTAEIQQLQETASKLEKQLEQQACEHEMECTGDKARIEYLLKMLDEESESTARPVSPASTSSDELALALEVSEERRRRAVQDLQQERELYAEKMKQVMLVVQQMEAQRD